MGDFAKQRHDKRTSTGNFRYLCIKMETRASPPSSWLIFESHTSSIEAVLAPRNNQNSPKSWKLSKSAKSSNLDYMKMEAARRYQKYPCAKCYGWPLYLPESNFACRWSGFFYKIQTVFPCRLQAVLCSWLRLDMHNLDHLIYSYIQMRLSNCLHPVSQLIYYIILQHYQTIIKCRSWSGQVYIWPSS